MNWKTAFILLVLAMVISAINFMTAGTIWFIFQAVVFGMLMGAYWILGAIIKLVNKKWRT